MITSAPPRDEQAERALLSSVFGRESALLQVLGTVRAEQFYSVTHQLVWESLVRLNDQQIEADVVTVANDLERRGLLDSAGGYDALTEIFRTVPHGAHADHYAEIVHAKWQERELRELCREALTDDAAAQPIGERIGAIESGCERILQSSRATGPATAADALMALSERWESGAGVGAATGFEKLDKLLGGLRPGTVNVIAARPGMGKSALAGCIARNFLGDGQPVMFASLEMSRAEIMQRWLALQSGVAFEVLEQGNELDEVESQMVTSAMSALSDLPILIDDTPEQSVRHIAATMRLAKKRRGLALGIIDYLQLIKPADPKVIREQQVAQMSRSLKVLARDLGIPLLLLAQLNRAVENRDNRKPRLSDLRESGSIEQDADSVLFIYEPDDDDPIRRDVVIAKNRHGPTGQISLEWHGRLLRFRDLVQPEVDHGFA